MHSQRNTGLSADFSLFERSCTVKIGENKYMKYVSHAKKLRKLRSK